jgi:Fe-S-cluster containining protein
LTLPRGLPSDDTTGGARDAAAPPGLIERYRRLLGRADAWFEQATTAHAGEVRCRRSCTLCCHGLFHVSPLDAAWIAEGARSAPSGVRGILAGNARRALEAVARVAPDWGRPWSVEEIGERRFDEICEALSDEPCPALAGDGACLVYQHRPLICRLHGIPIYDPGARAWLGGECELNFAPDGRRSDRTLWFHDVRFEEEQRRLERELLAHARRPVGRTIVAVALVLAGPRP